MIYGDLIEQYKNLDESEAHALLIYKSRLSRAINSLDIDDEEVIESYNTYKEYLENPSNIFMKMTVFKDIDFSDISSFKNSLKLVKKKIEDASLKIRLKDDLTVYRALSVQKMIQYLLYLGVILYQLVLLLMSVLNLLFLILIINILYIR